MSKKVRSSSTKGKTEEKAAPPPTKKSGAEPVILASGNYEINQVGFDDMTKMDDMTLDAVLENLKDRYAVDTIYTFTATILTAINPYKNLPIYDLRFVKRYKGVRLGILAPHVFSVAEQAYNDMIERKKNQSVLVSGESGAGKTMSTKYILRYLSDRTGKQSKIDEMVIASVPILEALGNAKTLRNDNSSRFGKFIEVQFDEDYTIAGSKTIPYLLEKSRITNHQNGERDFHIFYQLTEGMPKERQKLFKLGPATQFKYLVKTPDQAKFITIDGVDDAKEFQDFEKALEIFEVYEEVRNNIYRVISAVLWFGNVEYKAIGDKAALKDAESEQALKNAAELLSVDYEKLQWGLTNKKIKAMKEVIDKPLTAAEAKDMTDAVAKHIYSVLFEWLVEILNAGTACEHYISFIGVLDIFGFEVFELNSMEQFLINYTNERLQQFFNHYIFKLEQAEYEREQIDWTVIQFKDNQDTLDLIESKRPPGIISLLDEESKFPKATDDSLIEKLHTNLDKNPLYGKPRLQRRKFSVKHYAGVVEYEVSGWRDRNRDELPPLLVEALQGSNNQFMAILFTEDDEDRLLPVLMEREKRAFDEVGDGKEASPKANRRISFARGGGSALRKNAAGQEKKAAAEQGSAATKITLATQFKQQLLDLMTMLGSTDPFFIRCIKPNEHKKQDDFDQELIYNQLLYAGMLETIRIRRMGYPVRYIHRDFWKRFRVICPEVNPIDDMKQLSKNLAIALGLNIPGETQVGLTKVVLKQHTANELEDRRAIALTSTIIKMQTWWRWAFYRSKFINDRENAILLEAWWRYTRKRKVFLRQRRGACSIGQWWRMVQAIKAKKKLAEEKRKKEEEKRRKEEEARKKRIEKYGLDQVLAEEEAERKGEIDKLRELAAGAVPKEKKKKKKKKTRLERSSSIIMEKMEEVEIPINVDSKIVLGLGWKGRTAGLDASVIIFRYQQHRDDVYYYKPRSNDGAIMHRGGYQGMIRRGLEEGQTNDAEQIEINLNKVTPKANTIIVVVTVFDGDFSSTTDAYIRLLDDASGHEYARFTLQDAGSETARIMCKLTRQGHTRWRLKALGEPSQGRVFKHMITKVRPFLDEEPPKTKMTISVKEGEFKLRQTESRRRPTKSYKQLALYAEVYYDTEKEKTKSVKASPDKTMKPKWDQQRVLTGCSNYIEVAIFNNRGRFGGGQFLGRVVIDLGEKGEANDEWFDVEKPDEGVRSTYVEGKLRLSYSRV